MRGCEHEWVGSKCAKTCRRCGKYGTFHPPYQEWVEEMEKDEPISRTIICPRCGKRTPNNHGPHRPVTDTTVCIIEDIVETMAGRMWVEEEKTYTFYREICGEKVVDAVLEWPDEVPHAISRILARSEDQVIWILRRMWDTGASRLKTSLLGPGGTSGGRDGSS